MMMVHLYTKGPYLEVIVTNIPQAASKITHSDPQISTKPNNRINIKQRTSYDKGSLRPPKSSLLLILFQKNIFQNPDASPLLLSNSSQWHRTGSDIITLGGALLQFSVFWHRTTIVFPFTKNRAQVWTDFISYYIFIVPVRIDLR